MFSSFTLAALVAAQAVAPSGTVKWVPLNQPKVAQSVQSTAPVIVPAPAVSAPIAAPAPVSAPSVVNSAPSALSLTCLGAGVANKARNAFVGSSWGWATVASHHDRQFNDQVDLRLFNGNDRIRMPRTMLPGIHGGENGWFKLKDVVADARSIRASAAVGLLNNPKIFVDRVTGTISISGKSGDYSGQCQAIDANAPVKF